MQYINKYKTLYDLYFRHKNVFTDIFFMLVAVVLLAVMANITIPLWPVPITMQTFGIFAIAFFFGSRKGLLTIGLYILAGLIGFGVFANHKYGLEAIMGPTAGYIFGFLVAVFLVGFMIEKGYGRTKKSVLLVMTIGNIAIYIFGVTGLWIYLKEVTLWSLVMMGVIPFLIGDAIKIAGAVALFPVLWKKK